MTITPRTLSRAAGLAAAAAGLLFVAVQINHPQVDLALATTTEWKVRQTVKVLVASLALIGITGLYLRQVRQVGVLGLVGYLVFAVNFLIMLSVEVIGLVVLPSIASAAPGYVSDVLAVANGGTAAGDIGLMKLLGTLGGFAYVAGGLVFGTALFRAHVLARWAALTLAVGTVASLAIPVLPQLNERLFAVPTGIALMGLGYSLWRSQRTTAAAASIARSAGPRFDPAGAR